MAIRMGRASFPAESDDFESPIIHAILYHRNPAGGYTIRAGFEQFVPFLWKEFVRNVYFLNDYKKRKDQKCYDQ